MNEHIWLSSCLQHETAKKDQAYAVQVGVNDTGCEKQLLVLGQRLSVVLILTRTILQASCDVPELKPSSVGGLHHAMQAL